MKNPNDVPEDSLVERLGEIARKSVEAYQRSPVLRMLVMMNPALAVAEAGMLGTYAWFQNRRLQVFADEFTTLGLNITEEDVAHREFFDAYMSTAQHVLTESRDAKIRLFADLFGEFIESGCLTPIDRYEEYLLLLDEISEREFKLLLLMERHEAKHPEQAGENRLQRTRHFWGDFERDAKKELGLDSDNLQATLVRLQRTGVYHEITGGYIDYGGGRGYLTALFTEFLSALGISPEFEARVLPPSTAKP